LIVEPRLSTSCQEFVFSPLPYRVFFALSGIESDAHAARIVGVIEVDAGALKYSGQLES